MGQEFDVIKRMVSAEQAARYYGLHINERTHRAKCPFHNGEHENLSFHGGGYRCWVCGASGTSIDFTMNYLGLLSVLEAARRLDRDFSLGLFDKKPEIKNGWGDAEQEKSDLLAAAFKYWCGMKACAWRNEAASISFHLRETGYYYGNRGKRAARKRMLSAGRNYALLKRFIVAESKENEGEVGFGNYGLLIWCESPNLTDTEILRVYHLFAADRRQMKEYCIENKNSRSSSVRQDVQRVKEAYCIGYRP